MNSLSPAAFDSATNPGDDGSKQKQGTMMAETKKPKAAKTKAKKAPVRKAAVKGAPKRKPAANAKPRRREAPSTFDVTKLIDHPLVADLLAVGAMAAVAAIADHNVKTRTGEADKGSSKAVRAAGKAAASAIGKRLLTEVDAIRNTAKAPKKPKKA
jgi:hypothetical protein